MTDIEPSAYLETMIQAAKDACEAIMSVYGSETFAITSKADQSPVTAADTRAHQCIVNRLNDIQPSLPVLSEEGAVAGFSVRADWSRYWLIDPLDGTREFIAGTGQFAVSIALIEDHCAVLGVIALPVSGEVYAGARWGEKSQWHAFKQNISGARMPLIMQPLKSELRVLLSPRFSAGEPADLLQALRHDFEKVTCAVQPSAIKFCLIAEGKADLAPVLLPTSEWDVAAGQALVEAAGGTVVSEEGEPLRYNTGESLINRRFIVAASSNRDWCCYFLSLSE